MNVSEVNNDDCVHVNYKAFNVAEVLLKSHPNEYSAIHLKHRNVTVRALNQTILDYKLFSRRHRTGTIKQIPGDDGTRCNLPIEKWEYVSGDPQWLKKLYADFGWKLKEK